MFRSIVMLIMINPLVIIASQQITQSKKHNAQDGSLSVGLGNAAAILSKTMVLRQATGPLEVRIKAKDEQAKKKDKDSIQVFSRPLRDLSDLRHRFYNEWLECLNAQCKNSVSWYRRRGNSVEFDKTDMHLSHSAFFNRHPTDKYVDWGVPVRTLKIPCSADFIERLFYYAPPIRWIDFFESEGLVRIFIGSDPFIFDIDSGQMVYELPFINFYNNQPDYKTIDWASKSQKYRAYTTQSQKDWKGPFEIHIYENKEWTEKKDEKN